MELYHENRGIFFRKVESRSHKGKFPFMVAETLCQFYGIVSCFAVSHEIKMDFGKIPHRNQRRVGNFLLYPRRKREKLGKDILISPFFPTYFLIHEHQIRQKFKIIEKIYGKTGKGACLLLLDSGEL